MMAWRVRRLEESDAGAYHALRLEGFARNPLQFRVAPEDESAFSLDTIRARLAAAFVAGGFDESGLAGIAGLSRFEGAKLRHRALLWGMYLHDRARGTSRRTTSVRVACMSAGVSQSTASSRGRSGTGMSISMRRSWFVG